MDYNKELTDIEKSLDLAFQETDKKTMAKAGLDIYEKLFKLSQVDLEPVAKNRMINIIKKLCVEIFGLDLTDYNTHPSQWEDLYS